MKQLIEDLRAVNTNTKEGRYLFAALAMLTSQPKLILFGKEMNGEQMTPDQMIEQVDKLQKEIFISDLETLSASTGVTDEEIKDLKRVRNYFGEHDETNFSMVYCSCFRY
jgi:hypothetical protein